MGDISGPALNEKGGPPPLPLAPPAKTGQDCGPPPLAAATTGQDCGPPPLAAASPPPHWHGGGSPAPLPLAPPATTG